MTEIKQMHADILMLREALKNADMPSWAESIAEQALSETAHYEEE